MRSVNFVMKTKAKPPTPKEIQLTQEDVKILVDCVSRCMAIFPADNFEIHSASRLMELVAQTVNSYHTFLYQRQDLDQELWQLLNTNREGGHVIEASMLD
jgi:hypothetical protein